MRTTFYLTVRWLMQFGMLSFGALIAVGSFLDLLLLSLTHGECPQSTLREESCGVFLRNYMDNMEGKELEMF